MSLKQSRHSHSKLLAGLTALLVASPLAAQTPAPTAPEAPAAPSAAATPATPPTPATKGPRWETQAPDARKRKTASCRDVVTANPTLQAALRSLQFENKEGRRSLRRIEIVGLTSITPEALWGVLGGVPAATDAGHAALVLRQLAGLDLFASVTPIVDLMADDGPVLKIVVVEHATVKRVVIEGVSELQPQDLLDTLLEAPSRREIERREKMRPLRELLSRASIDVESLLDLPKEKSKLCPDPLPARDWVARAEERVVFPGIVWRGLDRGLDRMLERIYERGYELASLTAELASDGTLTVRVDEGRIGTVDIEGVEPALVDRVRRLAAIEPGRTFVKADLEAALQRVEAQLPFLRSQRGRRRYRPRPDVVLETASSAKAGETGPLRYVTREAPPEENSSDGDSKAKPEPTDEGAPTRSGRWYSLDDNDLVLHFSARRMSHSGSMTEIIRHTPVTSFAPGIEGKVRLWDPADRFHIRFDAGGNINTRPARANQLPPDAERWRFDGSGAVSLLIPSLRLAELGVLGYSRVDTSDRWRMNRLDSYLYSLLFNRADTDSFRRTGFTAFATFHLAQRATMGMEYRRDDYRSLKSAPETFRLFNRDERPQATAPIDDGRIGSLLLRLEYSTETANAWDVGGLRRDPERSLVERGSGRASWATFKTVNTLEIARPSLGSDTADFTRLVSDNSTFLEASENHGFKLRFRGSFRLQGDLPRQKRDALGGWSALRGYDWKEFDAGRIALLGTAEYRSGFFSLFLDAGYIAYQQANTGIKTSAGLGFNFGQAVHVDLAWRLDDRARGWPEARLFFHRVF